MRAVLLIVVTYLISLALPAMPSPVVASLWVIFTLVSTLGILYQASIKKANKQQQFVEGRIAAGVNNGRSFRLIGSFALSAALMASLLLESPKWDIAEWALITVAVVLYPLVKFIALKLAEHEYEPIFRPAAEVRWTSLVVGVLLCVGYFAYVRFGLDISQAQVGATIFDALMATSQPYVDASSALLQEAGIGMWLSDSVVNYGLNQLSQVSRLAFITVRVVLCGGAFFGVANLLGVCSLPRNELRKVLISTDAIKNNDARASVKPHYFVFAVILSAVLAGSFLVADTKTSQAMQTEEGTALQSLARQLAGKSVYIIDGKYYDQEKVDELASSLAAEQANFRSMAFDLKGSIEGTYGALNGNIDGFLNWYFSIATDDSVRSSISADNVRQTFEDQFYSTVAADDDEEITKKVKDYLQAASDLETKIDDGYRAAEVHGEQYANLPDWFVESKEFADTYVLNSYRQQAEKALDAARDSGLTSAFAEGDSLLAYQFKSKVYEEEAFKQWIETTEKITSENVWSSIAGRFGSFFTQGKRDEYRSDIVEQLDKCQEQALTLVAENTALKQ